MFRRETDSSLRTNRAIPRTQLENRATVILMNIYGIDFTSRPTRKKPITCIECTPSGRHLTAHALYEWQNFSEFEAALNTPGPWIAGINLPFGQARRFIETIGWPNTWQGYVDHVKQMDRMSFRTMLDNY